jgi:anti-sigma regulatory factor (Ser/Thr protein kinase)
MQTLAQSYPATAAAPGMARSALTALGLPEPPAHDLRLLVSELVTNSVRHADCAPEAKIDLRVDRRAGHVRVEVCDAGSGFDARVVEPDLLEPGGRGLFLVDRMSTRWGVEGKSETCVWFELALDDDDARGGVLS